MCVCVCVCVCSGSSDRVYVCVKKPLGKGRLSFNTYICLFVVRSIVLNSATYI